MKKEKRQFTELSEEDLRNVTGGTLSTADRCFGLTGQDLLECTGVVGGNPQTGDELKPGYPGGSELKPGTLRS